MPNGINDGKHNVCFERGKQKNEKKRGAGIQNMQRTINNRRNDGRGQAKNEKKNIYHRVLEEDANHR